MYLKWQNVSKAIHTALECSRCFGMDCWSYTFIMVCVLFSLKCFYVRCGISCEGATTVFHFMICYCKMINPLSDSDLISDNCVHP